MCVEVLTVLGTKREHLGLEPWSVAAEYAPTGAESGNHTRLAYLTAYDSSSKLLLAILGY